MSKPSFVANATGLVVPVVGTRTPPPHEPPRPTERYAPGDWVASQPGQRHGITCGNVTRAQDCAGLDNDQALLVLADGTPYLVQASEVHRVQAPR